MFWGIFKRRRFSSIRKGDSIEIDGKAYKVKHIENSTTLHIKDNFVPWWQGFRAYWRWWKDDSYFHWRKDRFDRRVRCHPDRSWTGIEGRSFVMEAIGWHVVIRTPLAMIHIAKCNQSCNRDGYESGIRIHWFPKRWSLRLREAEEMYRHTREWMNFIPKMAIRGLR